MNVLVVGLGRMGRIHQRVLEAAGHRVGTVDPVLRADFEAVGHALARARWQAAVVATPIPTLARVAGELVDAGVPVLVEKPAGASPAEVRALAAAAVEADVKVSVGFVERYNPAVAAVARALPRVGRPLRVVTQREGPIDPDADPRVDLGVHDADLVRYLGLDCPHELRVAALTHAKRRVMVVEGERGVIEADLRRRDAILWDRGEPLALWVEEYDALTREHAAFLRAVELGLPAPVPLDQAAAALEDVLQTTREMVVA